MKNGFDRFKEIVSQSRTMSSVEYDKLDVIDKPSRRHLCRELNMSWDSLRQLALRESPQPETPQQTYQIMVRQVDQYRRQAEKARDMGQVIYDACVSNILSLKFEPVKVPKSTKTSDNLEFHLLRSDAQVGQVTDDAWCQGLAKYNADLYEERVMELLKKIMLFKQQDEASLGLNKLVIYHLGDQVEGEGIFRGQAFALDLAGVDQLFKSVEVEGKFLSTLSGVFTEIEVFCVPGNHGRPAGKGDNHPKTNFDYIFYHILALSLKDQPNIKFYISNSPSLLVQNGKFLFLLNHGDAAKGWSGIPFYGLDRMSKRYDQLYGMIIDYNLCGHHHTPCNLADKVIMNGCLPGGSDLSVNRLAAASRPSQKCFYFHPEYGINRESNLYLADSVQLTADPSGVFTSYSTGVSYGR